MGKKKKRVHINRGKKQIKKKLNFMDRAKIAAIILAIFSPLFVYIFFKNQERNDLLQNNSFNTIAVIEKLKPRQRKGISGSEDVIYFKFLRRDTIIHQIEQVMSGEISRKNIKIGNAYEVKVVNTDYRIFKLNLETKIDYQDSNWKSKIHKYLSERHKSNVLK